MIATIDQHILMIKDTASESKLLDSLTLNMILMHKLDSGCKIAGPVLVGIGLDKFTSLP